MRTLLFCITHITVICFVFNTQQNYTDMTSDGGGWYEYDKDSVLSTIAGPHDGGTVVKSPIYSVSFRKPTTFNSTSQ